jgi:hypothetical protein
MKTIVVVCVPTRDAGLSAEKTVAGPNNASLQRYDHSGFGITGRSLKPSKRDQSMPPFWTWFIENPRGRGAA